MSQLPSKRKKTAASQSTKPIIDIQTEMQAIVTRVQDGDDFDWYTELSQHSHWFSNKSVFFKYLLKDEAREPESTV